MTRASFLFTYKLYESKDVLIFGETLTKTNSRFPIIVSINYLKFKIQQFLFERYGKLVHISTDQWLDLHCQM